jgi:tripartite-type tricarboxylate transporter receptor subunit TctC
MKFLRLALIPLLILPSVAARAQTDPTYPVKSIRMVVAYPPGGTVDLLARTIGQQLSQRWRQSVVVDNRPGGGANIGTEFAAKAPPDGYTIFMSTVANVINISLHPKLNFDFRRDFIHVTNLATVPGILVVHPSLPVKNVKGLIALAKARPNELRHGSAGTGSPHHLAGALFKSMAGVELIHVPYKGASLATNDILGGHIEVLFGAFVSTIPHVKTGRLRALGVTSLKRVPVAPDLPTLDEQALKGFDTASWFGVEVPRGTSQGVVSKLHGELMRIISVPELRDPLTAQGAQWVGSTPEEFLAFIDAQTARWAQAVKASGATAK